MIGWQEESFTCSICTEQKHTDQVGGKDPFDEPVCEACANSFDHCDGCGAVIEGPHRVGWSGSQLGQRFIYCCGCHNGPVKIAKTNRISTRRHPVMIERDQLDQECADRIERDA